jgi:hypothetical protein
VTIAPEIYRVHRHREGGTSQHGTGAGIRLSYDYIKRYNFYVGARGFYGGNVLHGHTGNDDKIRSRYRTGMIEGDLGYTFEMKCFPHVSFTPFAGYGYFKETNHFTAPSPLEVKFTTQFRYVSFGFLSSTFVLPAVTVGLNTRFKYPLSPRCKVSGDDAQESLSQLTNEKLHWRIELPITYFGCSLWNGFEAALMPFYERQVYGARENFPFDFFKTTYTIFGIDFQMIYRF